VNGAISCQKGEAVGQFKDVLVRGAPVPQAGRAQSRFVDQLQRQARLDTIGPLRRPRADQVPGTQPEQFGGKQPDAGQVAHDLVGEELAHSPFDAPWIAREGSRPRLGGLRLQGWLGVRAVAIKFFFEDRTPR
jgi:hypothetical protein